MANFPHVDQHSHSHPASTGRGRRGHRSLPKRRRSPSPRFRVLLVWGLLLLAILGLVGRLAQLQLVQGDMLHRMVQQQQVRVQAPTISRRPIIDSQGNLLALDRIVYTLYGHPVMFRQPTGIIAQTLSPFLDQPAATLSTQLRQQETGVRIADDLSEETARRIRQLRLDGLELVPEQRRFYPQQDLFAQTIGFINLEGKPQGGLEASEQDRLRLPLSVGQQPMPGSALAVVDSPRPLPLPLQLTLDARLQQVAKDALEKTLQEFTARRGTIMVMDVHTGALKAFVVDPSFDPNRYFEADLDWLKNWALTDLYEPGSTLKPINLAIALETNAIKPTDTVYDEGRIQIDEWPIQNADYESTGRQGTLTISQVLEYSSNVGMVHIMNALPASQYYQWLEKLDIGEPTGIDLPAESATPLKARSQFVNSPVEVATAAFGQGLVMTPVKLLQLQAAIANGGKLVIPHVIRGLVDESGALQWQPLRRSPKVVFSPETTQTVLDMMEAVVETGTGKAARIPGYRIAGKTGTAQKVTAEGTYGSGRITSFVGILPADAPRFVVLAVIDEPQGDDSYGSTVAAPLVKTVMESLLVFEGIPPSSPQALGGILTPKP